MRPLHFAFVGFVAIITLQPASVVQGQAPVFANGLKFGDATDSSVIVWTRLASQDAPDRKTFLIPAVAGRARLKYRPVEVPPSFGAAGDADHDVEDHEIVTDWVDTDKSQDGTVHFRLESLQPGTTYTVTAEAVPSSSTVSASDPDDGNGQGITDLATIEGRFKTAPSRSDSRDISFAVMTCQKYIGFDDGELGFRTYRTLSELNPDWVSHTGDAVYYDQDPLLAKNVSQARAHWHRMYALPNLRDFHRRHVCYFIKDDHDTLKDDCWTGQKYGDLTFQQGVAIHREQNPIGDSPYRTVRWGRHLQVWFAEGREYRVPNRTPDGPEKTIWGATQLDWFEEGVKNSDATFKVLIQATPLVGPDREKKNDNHANAGFKTEGDRLRRFLAAHDVIAINGDRHWQYVSVDPQTKIWEFGTGPVHDARAQGWKQDDVRPEHRFLRVAGGFLFGRVTTDDDGDAILTLSHHDVTGTETHQEVFPERPVDQDAR